MEGETASYIERPPNPVQQHLQDVVAGFAPGGGGRLPVTGKSMLDGLTDYQGNQQKGTPLTTPLIRSLAGAQGKYVGRPESA